MTRGIGRRIIGGALAGVGFIMFAFWVVSGWGTPEGSYLIVMLGFLIVGSLMALLESDGSETAAGPEQAGSSESQPAPEGGLLVCGRDLAARLVCARPPSHEGDCSVEHR